MALYNIPIGFKIFAVIILHQRNDTFARFLHLQDFCNTKSGLLQALILLTSNYTDMCHKPFLLT